VGLDGVDLSGDGFHGEASVVEWDWRIRAMAWR
jgi:hypothetical protein